MCFTYKNCFQKRNRKKRKQINGTGRYKTKRNRNKSQRVKKKKIYLNKSCFSFSLCRSLLVGWCGGCLSQLSCLFILFLKTGFSIFRLRKADNIPFTNQMAHQAIEKDNEKSMGISPGIFVMFFPVSVQNSLISVGFGMA